MYLRDVASSLVRRWYLTLAGILLTAGLVAVALQLVHPAWESEANLVLLPPRSTILPGGNPYLQLGGLSPTLDLLVVKLSDEQVRQAVKGLSTTATYTVKADTTSSGPVLLVTATDRTPASSIMVRDELIREAPIRLAALQESLSISPNARITSMVLTQDPRAQTVSKNQIRAVVVAAGVGLVGTALVVALVDGVGVRRRRQTLKALAENLEGHLAVPEPAGPVVPISPVVPVPVMPVPVMPVDPVVPVDPVLPVDPVIPVEPVLPVSAEWDRAKAARQSVNPPARKSARRKATGSTGPDWNWVEPPQP
jgi:hypothetical protein